MPPLPPPPAAGAPPTLCVMLTGCFDGSETEPGWAADIHAELAEELGKHGRVVFSAIDVADAARGSVYAMLADVDAAQRAVGALRGRRYDGRTLGADLVPLDLFLRRWPESAAAAQAAVGV